MSIRGWVLATTLLITGAGCGNSNLTPPTSPTPPPTTETFSGSLNPNGAATYPFIALAGGTVTAQVTSVNPDVVIGVSLGTWNTVTCQIIIANDKAIAGSIVIGTVASVGNLCVRVYDVGDVKQSTAYEIQIVHP